jgi:L-glutamine:2-deoxy-scyllo-inosose/3-amino-2,3-dideoxy-scyllo-inosose aminotransferase
MAKLAIFGGKPIGNLMENVKPGYNTRLERKYLLDAYESGKWDDWSDDSQASRFKKEFAKFQTAKYCTLVTNGTHSLQLALEALGIGWGDEVIVPGMTWQATASVVADVNAVPVLVDIDPETFCIDVKEIEKHITRRTRAIIPVHLFSRTADMDAIMRLARKHGLRVIEDCAHAHGSRFDGKGAGSIGDIGSFSFQRSKTMNCGEGGGLITNNLALHRKIESLRNCGRTVGGEAVHSGNYRMTSLQAGILRGQLDWMKRTAPKMDAFHRALDKALSKAPGVRALRRNPRITRQCGYGVGFRYDSESFDGLPGGIFRDALKSETGIGFHGGYDPINESGLYRPGTKKRSKISREYLKAIDPRRWKLPVSRDVRRNSGMITGWNFSLMPVSRLPLFADAIEKIYDNRKELLRRAKEFK